MQYAKRELVRSYFHVWRKLREELGINSQLSFHKKMEHDAVNVKLTLDAYSQ